MTEQERSRVCVITLKVYNQSQAWGEVCHRANLNVVWDWMLCGNA